MIESNGHGPGGENAVRPTVQHETVTAWQMPLKRTTKSEKAALSMNHSEQKREKI
jgi:hypothetical protein